MRYTIYTTVDITNTEQYRNISGQETDRWKEQNFQTVLQTLGMRANISFSKKPELMTVAGSVVGFKTNKIIKVWVFEFEVEREYLFGDSNNTVSFLINDFEGVPYISGLDESMEQNYAVFVTDGDARNIIFKQL